MESDWLKKLALPLAIALSAGVARTIASGESRSFGQFLQGLFIAGFVGSMTALALAQTSYSEPFKGFVIGLASFAGEDVLMGLLKLSRQFGVHPLEAVKRWLKILK